MTLTSTHKKIAVVVVGLILLVLVGCVGFEVLKNGFGPGIQDYSSSIDEVCRLNRNSVHEIFIVCDGVDGRIEPKVVSVGWNENYIVAATHPVTKRKYQNNPDNTYKIPDEDVTYWWIFDLQGKALIGPIDSENQFNDDLKSRGISGIEMIDTKQLKD